MAQLWDADWEYKIQDIVAYEVDDNPEWMYLQDPESQRFLTAHRNCKHVYWSADKSTWQQFKKDPETGALITAHNMNIWFDDEQKRFWQTQTDAQVTKLYGKPKKIYPEIICHQ